MREQEFIIELKAKYNEAECEKDRTTSE